MGYVVGVNEGDYDAANDTDVSNASCTTNGMASVCKVLDDNFSVEYGMMTTMVMGEDLVKVVMWYDNEWGYSQRVVDLTAIVADTLPQAAEAPKELEMA